MPKEADIEFDAFISYSRKDAGFARRLEATLEKYRPPRGLGLPRRHLRIFRDEADFTGTEYAVSLERNLAASSKLLLLCSPASRESPWVGEEITQFAEHRGAAQIVTVLVDGVPNNEVTDGEPAPRAFHDRLVERLPVPLAADYRGFDPARDKVDRGGYRSSWYKLLADLFQEHGISRAQIEQRDERRRRRRRAIATSVTAAVIVALAGLATWALIERREAIRNERLAEEQRNIAQARQLVAEAELAMIEKPEQPELSLLLAVEAMRRAPSVEADRVLRKAAAVVPEVVWAGRHEGPVRDLAYTADGRHLWTASDDGTVRRWEAASGAEQTRLRHDGPVRAVAASADGRWVASGGANGSVRLFDGEGRDVWTTECPGPVTGLALAADGASLVATSREEGERHLRFPLRLHRLRLSDGALSTISEEREGVGLETGGRFLTTLEWVREIEGDGAIARFEGLGAPYGELVRSAAVSADGRQIAIGTRDTDPYAMRGEGWVRLYDASGGERFRQGYAAGIHELVFSPLGDLLLTAGEDGTGRILSTAGGREIWRLSHAGQVRAVGFDPAGDRFATGGDDGEVRVSRLGDPALRWRLPAPAGLLALSLSADGGRLATLALAERPARLAVWEVGGERLVEVALDPEDDFMEPRPLALGADGLRLVTGSMLGVVEQRDATTGRVTERRPEEDNRPVVLVATSSDGRLVATGSWDETVRTTGATQWQIRLTHRPTDLAFSEDARLLVAGSEDGRLRVLQADNGRTLHELDSPAAITAVAIDPDGRRIAAGGRDRAVRVLDLEGATTSTVIPLTSAPDGLAFSDDTELLLARREAEWIVVEAHPLAPAALIRRACGRRTRNLTAGEWADYLSPEEPRATCPGISRRPG